MSDLQTIVLGGGCFWCTEAVYKEVRGVTDVESGYSNGETQHPSYEQVCTGRTGHNEVVRLTYDPEQVSTRQLLEIFFVIHDPTQLNRQGNDVGTQYRSAIFPLSPEQEAEARKAIERAKGEWPEPIVTTIEPMGAWYPAEDYHQDYWSGEGQSNPYCLAVIPPKLKKLRKSFANRVKADAAAV
jgi:peptide-methionine (S)-S-oxide reductase